MKRKQSGGSFWSGKGMRLLSFVLAFAMLISLVPGSWFAQADAAAQVDVYFKDSDGWGNVYGYAWDSNGSPLLGAWPGTKLSADGNGLYKLPVSASGISFIFNNNAGAQTGDLSLGSSQASSGKSYWVSGAAGTVNVYEVPTAVDGKVTFTYEGSGSQVLLAGTMNDWSGVAMTKSGSTFTYTCDLSAGMYEYKFVVDGSWINDPRNPQTTGSDNNNYIVVSGSSGDDVVSGGTGNTVKLHFQNTLGWGTVCGSAWVITGTTSSSLAGWSWPGQALQKDADGNYVMEVQPGLVSGQSLGYLFHDFDKQQTVDLTIDAATIAQGNVELWVKPGSANEEGKYTCTTSGSFTPSPKVDGNQVTFTYTGSATSVAVAGTFNSWSGAKMTKSGSTFTYTTTLEDGIYQYKFILNGSDWITDPSNSTVAGSDGNSVLFVGDHTANTDADKITVQFHVTKTGGYTGWDAWVWSDGVDGTSCALQTGTLADKLVSVTVDGSSSYVGFILRKSDWSTQDDTYYVDLKNISSGTVHCYVDYAASSMPQISDRDVTVCGSLSYAKLDYESNVFWVKTTAPMEMDGVTVTDAEGNATDVTVTDISAEGFGYNLSLSRQVTLEDLPNLRIRLNGSECRIEPNDYLFYSSRFSSEYTYNGDDLGATWTKNSTTFKVWAPTAWKMQVVRYQGGRYDSAWIETVDMTRGPKGVWSVTIPGDLNGTYYNYVAHFAGYTTEATDPYAKSTGPNSDRSMVLDMTSTNPAGWDNDISPNQGMTYTDAIIYEMHVREFTLEESSGVKAEWRGKYLGLTQTGTNYQGRATGIDHLKELGITHVQLMPVYDFGWPDEYGDSGYSWGYNPRHFNVPEGSYATDAEHGEVRVNEFKQMVQAFHSNGINVVMDVVYNHLDSAGDFCYNKLVPYYFTRFWDKNGDWSGVCNGSGVGNDFATQRSMARNYIVDSLSMWVEEYHVDGFRFDLAGLIDTQTINEAISVIQAKYPSVIFYGEGWDNYGTNMEGYDTTTQYNHWKVPSFGFFNNTLRDALGGNEGKDNGEWGFAMGSSEKAETVMYSMRAMNSWSSNPNQTINYVSCHDGYTLTDKICTKRGGAYWSEIAAMNRLAGATILLSQGIPMIYSGDEILREKLAPAGWRAHNSGHESGVDLDALNTIKWSELVTKDYAQTNDDYYAGLIEFRKNHSALRCSYIGEDGTPDAQRYTSCHRVSDQCILLYVDGYPNYECSDGIVIILNSGSGTQWVNFYDYGVPYGDWQACIHGDKAGINALWTTSTGSVGVEGYSATVLVKGDLVDEDSVYNRQTGTGCRHTTHGTDGKCTSCGASVSHSYVNGTCKICGKIQEGSDTTGTIYFDATGSGWTGICVYAWDDVNGNFTGEWPGSAMTQVEGNLYAYEVPTGATKIIFNNGNGGEGNQTNDLVIPTDGKNLYTYVTGSWSTQGSDSGDDPVIVPTVTIYLDAQGSNWSKVNVYTWNTSGQCTGTWPGSAMTQVEGSIYSYEVPAAAVNIIFNDGTTQTDDLTIPTDGKNIYYYATNSWGTYSTGCSHVYDEGVITKDASCGVEGEITYTCTLCGHSYTNPTMPLAHNYVDGKCTLCGETDPGTLPTTYYLVGYINGADHGCEGDAENMGDYKFVDGKLTATFDSDSYVFVKTEGNGKWFLADAYTEESTCTFKVGGTEKMKVPGGVEITFTLVENEDGSVTLSYTTAAASLVPTLKQEFPTLTFEDMISMNVYVSAQNDEDIVEMGLMMFDSKLTEFTIDDAARVVAGYSWSSTYNMYVVSTGAIAAKDMSDTVNFATYAKLADGTYAYTPIVSYSPTNYAYSLLNTGDQATKDLMVAMLNYGAEAQTFFSYRTDALMNARLTEDQKASIETYRADMMDAVSNVSDAKAANFTKTDSGFTRRYPSISFEGAFKINYYCTPSAVPAGDITLYYWNQADFDAADVLTVDNATDAIVMTENAGNYETAITGIAAKDLDKGVYVAFVYTDGTNTYCSGILGYSIGAYCVSNAASTAAIAPFAAATAVYGYYAKQMFGN